MPGFDLTKMTVLPFTEPNDDGWTFQVHVRATGLIDGPRPLYARLSEQELEGVTVYSDGNGFSGFLREAPQDGQRLFVHYAGAEEQETELVFHPADV